MNAKNIMFDERRAESELHRIEMAKKEGAHDMLTNCPFCILSLEKGLELMRELDEPMEFGIFDFYKVFSKAFGEEEDGVGGNHISLFLKNYV